MDAATPEDQALRFLDRICQPADARPAIDRGAWAVAQESLATLDRANDELKRLRMLKERLRAAGLPAPWRSFLE